MTTTFATSYQVNVDGAEQNIVGDAANEPSLCIDSTNPNRLAIGWRQFDSVASSFRQAGWAYSTNGGLTWILGRVLETNVFRSDPVLSADADGRFYYLSVQTSPTFHCDLWRSTNGGANWGRVGLARGGDKPWMTIDQTSSPGRGNIYQGWSTAANTYSNRIFSFSRDGGATWADPIAVPHTPFWGTLDVGPSGQLYLFGWDGAQFWLNRSTDATNRNGPLTFDLTSLVNLGGSLLFSSASINPVGLIGQPWVAVDKSTGPTRGNVYALCSVTGTGNPADIMFARSTNGGATWDAPARINDDSPTQGAWHWFGTLSVAPNGRIDACWNDTRNSTNNIVSELFYSYSNDGGLSWAPNIAISPPFDPWLGYPQQQKMGDYIGMISQAEAACIAYTATFNGEEDIYFTRVAPPILTTASQNDGAVRLSWNATIGSTYCVLAIDNLITPWSAAQNLGCLTATNTIAQFEDALGVNRSQRFYRVVKQP